MPQKPNAAPAKITHYLHGNVANVHRPGVSPNRARPKRKPGELPSQRREAARANAASAHHHNAARAVPGGYRKTQKRSTRRH
jgi:hypothetical protein